LIKILRIILGLALLGALFWSGWRIYHRLPSDGSRAAPAGNAGNFQLNIVLRDANGGNTTIELYPIEFAAVQRAYRLNGRPGSSIEDYLALQLKNLPAVRVQLDQSGRAIARLSAGHWWMRATSTTASGELMEWRLPLTISQPVHTVELSGANAYERTKKF
jgi:hypothetical protein